jgi:hypothetical protein
MTRRTPEAWRAVVTGFGSSGLTIEAYCARQGICKGSFYRWQAIHGSKTEGRHPIVKSGAIEPAFLDLGALQTVGSRVELRVDLGRGIVLQLTCG